MMEPMDLVGLVGHHEGVRIVLDQMSEAGQIVGMTGLGGRLDPQGQDRRKIRRRRCRPK
jgi:hypothetical protein